MTVAQISREFDNGASETWNFRAAALYRAYVLQMLSGKKSSGRVTTSVRLRMSNGQMVVIKPKAAKP